MGIIKVIDNNKIYLSVSWLDEIKVGQSIAHDGVCLTVAEKLADTYMVELMPETFVRSHFKQKKINDFINLERCLLVNGRFDGHIVQGHTDFVSEIIDITLEGNATIFKFKLPHKYQKFLVDKGSIAINGISLTVIEAKSTYFTVGIIPHTIKITNLQYLSIGSLVNIETDILAKYLVKLFIKN